MNCQSPCLIIVFAGLKPCFYLISPMKGFALRTLLLDVDRLPQACGPREELLNAYPQLLLEGLQLWQRLQVRDLEQAIQVAQHYEPAVIAVLGTSSIAPVWARQLEAIFPRLFVIAHPPAASEAIMDAINLRTWELRRQRLAGRTPMRPPPACVVPKHLFAGTPLTARESAIKQAQRWLTTDELAPLFPFMDTETFERGLYCFALLESQLSTSLPQDPAALDIGCHKWTYAPFQQAFLKRFGKPRLTGLEIDPWYLQGDGLSRHDWACASAELAQAQYIEGDPCLESFPEQDLITLLMPLIMPENAVRWGLPLNRHDPLRLLSRIRTLLRPGGQALLYLGVDNEYSRTLELIKDLNWPPEAAGPYFCPLRQQELGYVIRLAR